METVSIKPVTLTESQIISIASTITNHEPLPKAYERATGTLLECNLKITQILPWVQFLLHQFSSSSSDTTNTTKTAKNTRCNVGLILLTAALQLHAPRREDLKPVFEIIKIALSSKSSNRNEPQPSHQMAAIGKDMVTVIIVWYKKTKGGVLLPPDILLHIPILIECLSSLNEIVIQNIDQMAIVWKKGIMGLTKLRANELMASPSIDSQDLDNLINIVFSKLSQNIRASNQQFIKELKRDSGSKTSTTSSSTNTSSHNTSSDQGDELPPGFQVVKFWCVNLMNLVKSVPGQCARLLPRHSNNFLNLLLVSHPVFGVVGGSKLVGSSVYSVFLQSISSAINLLLQSEKVELASKKKLLQMYQPPPVTNVARGDPRDVARLLLSCELLVQTNKCEKEVQNEIYRLLSGRKKKTMEQNAGSGSGNGNGNGNGNGTGNGTGGGGIPELIKRCYSQIVLMDTQVEHLLKRGVSITGTRLKYHDKKESTDGSSSSSSTIQSQSGARAQGVQNWEGKEPSSLLLKTLGSVVHFVAHASLTNTISTSSSTSTSTNTSITMMEIISSLLTDEHPAVVEIGTTMLSAMIHRLPTQVSAADHLSSIVSAVLVSSDPEDIQYDATSIPSAVLRAVDRALPMLNEQGMNVFARQSLRLPQVVGTTTNNTTTSRTHHEELCRFASTLRHVTLDSVVSCVHVTSIYTKYLPTLVQSLTNNTVIITKRSSSKGRNSNKIEHIPSLSSLRLTLDILQRLTSQRTVWDRSIGKDLERTLTTTLWDLGNMILSFLSRSLQSLHSNNESIGQHLQQKNLIETTLSSAIGLYTTTIMLRNCQSSKIVIGLLKQIGKLLAADGNVSDGTKVRLACHTDRALRDIPLQNMEWYTTSKTDVEWMSEFFNTLKTIINCLCGDEEIQNPKKNQKSSRRGGFNSAASSSSSTLSSTSLSSSSVTLSSAAKRRSTSWVLFHCGLNIARASMFVMDNGVDPSKILSTKNIPFLIAYLAGESKPHNNNNGNTVDTVDDDTTMFLAEDVLRMDEHVLVQMQQTNALAGEHSLMSLSSKNVSFNKVRKANDGDGNDGGGGSGGGGSGHAITERRPSKRPRLNPNMTSALPATLNDMVHVVRDGLVDMQEYINSKQGIADMFSEQSKGSTNNQLSKCVSTLQTLLDTIGLKKNSKVA